MRRLLFAVGFGLLTVGCTADTSQSTATEAWYLRATFEARDENIEGLHVRTIDPNWERASVLRTIDVPREAKETGDRPEDHGFSFALDADLDGDGTPERAVVGVFRARSGKPGRFLLVLGRSQNAGAMTKKALFTDTHGVGFSAIGMRDGRVRWVTCFDCDSWCDLIFQRSRYRLECSTCC